MRAARAALIRFVLLRSRVRVDRVLGLLGLLLVPTLAELLDDLLVERRQVVRLAARDETLVDHDLLVDPLAPGVADVGLEARPRRDLAAAYHARFDQHPRAVADDANRLALLEEVAHEGDGVLVRAHRVRVPDPTRDHERVVVGDARFLDDTVDAE